MRIGRRSRTVLLALTFASLLAPASAAAQEQHVVDDDRVECPSADHTSIAAAVAAAAPGDTVSVCDGTYREGSAGAGASALTIDKDLTLRGAGARRVYLAPTGSLAADTPQLRDGAGNIITVTGGADVTISGLTIFGGGHHVEAGVAFINADGRVYSSEIIQLARAGQYTGQTGVGFVAASSETDVLRSVTLEDSLVEGYDAAGVVIDGALAGGTLRTSSAAGVFALITENRITGGDVATDGVRLLNRATAVVVDNLISDNTGAGVAAINSISSSQTRFNNNNIQGNGVGFRHDGFFGACGATTQLPGQPNYYRLDAVQNWWGSTQGPTTSGAANRGDSVNGDAAVASGCTPAEGPANTTNRVDYRNFLTRPYTVPAPTTLWQDAQPTVSITAPLDGSQLTPGGTVTITATVADDIGVRSVTFLRGDEVLSVDSTAPYTATYTPQGDDAYSSQAITAIVTDSRGQTSAHSISVGASEDESPYIELLEPEPTRNGGWELYAIADDDRGVEEVTFYLDGEEECVDTEPPFVCRVRPRFEPRDRLGIVAIATDSNGQTSTALGTLRLPNKLQSRGLSLKVDRGSNRRIYAEGRLRFPDTIRRRDACDGEVEVTLRARGDAVRTRTVELDNRCEYVAALRAPRGEYRVRARFLGNDVLRPITAPVKEVTIR